jgi:signal transduction histidine kinase
MVVHDEHALVHTCLIGSGRGADESDVHAAHARSYRSWLVSELIVVSVLALATVILALGGRLGGFELENARLALDTAVGVVAAMVAVLVAIRFQVEGRLSDLLLTAGFATAALGTLCFGVVPRLADGQASSRQTWAMLVAELLAACVIAAASLATARVSARRRSLAAAVLAAGCGVAGVFGLLAAVSADGPLATDGGARTPPAVVVYAALAILALVAAIGFGLRFRRHARELDSWLALGFTLVVFADLHYVLAPAPSTGSVLQGDFLRLLAYAVLLFGVWRAIGEAEFGRAVAEERARVAREIHDGLAQYLFALSTHVSMLERGAPLEEQLPRLKEASTAAQQEARFAVLALSSASGAAPFDAALRRYVDFLAADGVLEVEVDIDPAVRLAPDEQIELFRIVQEGLANARRHAGARRAWVTLEQRGGRRVVAVRDDGVGFDGDGDAGGQGLRNMRSRAASIDGGFSLRSSPGRGTAIEVVLRAA